MHSLENPCCFPTAPHFLMKTSPQMEGSRGLLSSNEGWKIIPVSKLQ